MHSSQLTHLEYYLMFCHNITIVNNTVLQKVQTEETFIAKNDWSWASQ